MEQKSRSGIGLKRKGDQTMQQQHPQPGQQNVNPSKQAAPAQKQAQGAKPLYPSTNKIDDKPKKKDDSCGC
jgi:hypothetical protein